MTSEAKEHRGYVLIEPPIHEDFGWDMDLIVGCLEYIRKELPYILSLDNIEVEYDLISVGNPHGRNYPSIGAHLPNPLDVDKFPEFMDLDDKITEWVNKKVNLLKQLLRKRVQLHGRNLMKCQLFQKGEMDKLQQLYTFINNRVNLTDSDKALISESLKIESFKKGDQIVRLNQTCQSLKFVVSGIYRVYKLEEGKEITSYFNYEDRNPFVASFVSLLTESPSNEIVECIEDGELLSINYKDWLNLYIKSKLP